MPSLDPQQELFIAYKLALEAMGYSVYDGVMPPLDTPYPFIYFGDFRQNDKLYKNAVTGFVYPTIHIWHNNIGQRGTVSRMISDVKWVIYTVTATQGYSWLVQSVDQQIITDETTNTPLLHGVVEAGLKFS